MYFSTREMASFKEVEFSVKGLIYSTRVQATEKSLLTKKPTGETVQPHVIEPAFGTSVASLLAFVAVLKRSHGFVIGIGRIMYSVFEHSFRQRKVENDTEKRWVMLLVALMSRRVKF